MKITIDGKDFETENLSENANKSVQNILELEKIKQSDKSSKKGFKLVSNVSFIFMRMSFVKFLGVILSPFTFSKW